MRDRDGTFRPFRATIHTYTYTFVSPADAKEMLVARRESPVRAKQARRWRRHREFACRGRRRR